MRWRFGAFGAGLVLAAGCSYFGPGQTGDCYQTRLVPARMFAIEAPATGSAQASVSLTPWVTRQAPLTRLDQLATQSFKAEVDVDAKTITVTGQVFRTEAVPGSGCTYPALAIPPEPATVSLEIQAPAGTYLVRIPETSYTSERPVARSGATMPEAAATRSLVLE